MVHAQAVGGVALGGRHGWRDLRSERCGNPGRSAGFPPGRACRGDGPSGSHAYHHDPGCFHHLGWIDEFDDGACDDGACDDGAFDDGACDDGACDDGACDD
ncbi:MAG: hypothetical protein CL468_04210, partial [Acidimicrobiaceae bacterium]|nr:hypothetical protein [Acidimicrobiaceae bacterium]